MSVGKITRYGLPFANVVASGVATNNLTPGRTLEALQLKLGGTSLTKAMITMFKLKANGKTLIEATGTELDKINAYHGIATNAAYLDIRFVGEKYFTELDRQVSAFDTSLVANITTEVTIAGATAPTITPILVESASQKDVSGQAAAFAGLVGKVLRYPFSIANGGQLPVTVPFGAQSGAIIKALHVIHTGNMLGATVKEDGMVIHESLAAENAYMQSRVGRVPQANMYTIDFCIDGTVVGKALNTRTARSLEWLLNFSAADNGIVLVEYLDAIGNL